MSPRYSTIIGVNTKYNSILPCRDVKILRLSATTGISTLY